MAAASLLLLIPFAVLFLVHHFLVGPLLYRKRWLYLMLTALLLGAFGVWCFKTGQPPEDRPPMDRPALPPDGMPAPPEGEPVPPPDGIPGPPPDGRPGPPPKGGRKAPLKPQWLELMAGIFLVAGDIGLLAHARMRKVEKERERQLAVPPVTPLKAELPDDGFFQLKLPNRSLRIETGRIRYVEAMGEYIKIHLTDETEPLVVLYRMKNLAEELPEDRFVRIHRSYIIALDRIQEIKRHQVTLDDKTQLPIGESYRKIVSLRANSPEKEAERT